MKILLLLSESWNDNLYPNNNLTNWFTGFPDAEIWTISGSGYLPENNVCKDYFLLDQSQMLKSIITRKPVGKTLHYDVFPANSAPNNADKINADNRLKLLFAGEVARFVRDCAWCYGKYDLEQLSAFIDRCKPDIVFSQRIGSVKMCRLERIVSSLTDAPLVAYSGDDEYSLHQYSLNPVFWIRKFWVRRWLRKVVPTYKLFFSMSDRQMKEYHRLMGVETKYLVKCGDFDSTKVHTFVNKPIQLLYAGKLYCNRWKTLAMIASAIRGLNDKVGLVKYVLNIYTGDIVTDIQNRELNDGIHSIIHGRVPGSALPRIFAQSDIVLHVESFDKKNRLLTKDSFSTKVIDCLSSGCAVMAICWEEQAAFKHLVSNDAAFTASSQEQLNDLLEKIAYNENLVVEYAQKAYSCGSLLHQRQTVQHQLYSDFKRIIEKSQC